MEPNRLLRTALLLLLLCAPSLSVATEVTDATGRTVSIPDRVDRVLPAGPPAAVLLAAIAPAQLIGFTSPVTEQARAALAPAVGERPEVPRLTGQADATAAIAALHPDLIVDYGTVSARYKDLAQETQRRTGVPTLLLDGAVDKIPEVARTLGKVLHQPEQAEAVARFAEAILSLPVPPSTHPRVLYARGADGLLVAAPDTDVTALFVRLGWQVVAPEGKGTFRPASIDAIRALDPDILIFSDPAMRTVLQQSEAWAGVRAVRDGKAYIAPSVPFGWIEEPPSINRLLGLAWLRGSDPVSLAAMFNTVVYGRVLTSGQLLSIAGTTPSFKP
jgi:iron complex transport system substrate-binding protein